MTRLTKSFRKVETPSNPVVFVSYPARLAYRAGQLGADLRKRGIEVISWPRERDRDGEKLVASIERHGSRSAVLLLILNPSMNHVSEGEFFANVVRGALSAAPIRRRIRNTFYIQFTPEEVLADYVDRNAILPLYGDYTDNLDRLIAAIGSPRRHFRRSRKSEVSHVTGSFEVARSSTEMFGELQKEISEGAIDQKYLYWDVRAADRWSQIVNGSTYMTAQSSMNLLAARADAIISRILQDVDASGYSFINFGVGTGVKDYLILEELLTQQDGDVLYFPVDESLPMIQITIQDMQELISDYSTRLKIHYVLDDFANVSGFSQSIMEREQEHFKEARPGRIIAFLGGSLGNFEESEILKSLSRLFVSPQDRCLLGVEFLAERSDNDLIANYDDEVMKRFLYGPILDVEGVEPDWNTDFRYEVRADRSAVGDAKTVVGYVKRGDELVELFQSTKYERVQLEKFLERIGFKIIESYMSDDRPPRFAKYLLRLEPPAPKGGRR